MSAAASLSHGSLVCKAVEMMFYRGPAGVKSRGEWRPAPACCGSGERYGPPNTAGSCDWNALPECPFVTSFLWMLLCLAT